ncbi:MAG: electron transfer flavoprotein subunit alpha/FixB family protein [Actinomyces ruminicola]|uniref:Electron transfer flavoprotein alpha subunit n=1 Tax=Actinomyces ruminicola TaxID=332524 RepID=A0A1G9XQH8_9ACTO|nr:electron transfer flavoprotein subunit alpha/FixB family protein [Actinomyces ruminicola]MBE6481714.1 electron transfer flavoprotein subunit alpha/FixB family protein [Actinomyces ruminicola]SDM99018.1 electron transfer flavoprotein alpha subunit [Actinomyces ruminicola]
MSDNMLDAPVLVLVDRAPGGAPTSAALGLVSIARGLTSGDVVALVAGDVDADTIAALAAVGASRLLNADLGGRETVAAVAADAVVAAVKSVSPAVALVGSDYRGKEIAGRAAVLLGSACASDVGDLRVVGGELHASKLVLSGTWSTTMTVSAQADSAPVISVHPSAAEPVPPATGAEELPVEAVDVPLTAEAAAVKVVSRELADAAAGPDLSEAQRVVVMGRGTDGDLDLVHSLADPLQAAIGATRVACDEGWIERSAQVGQTGASIAPRLYIGLGVSGAVHHTSGIQGAGTIVAVCDDSEAPIFEMADYGVVGDVAEVVPQLVEELERLRG